MQTDRLEPRARPVSNGYLTAIGARLIEGRELSASDTAAAAPAIVISRVSRGGFFGAAAAVGQFVDWHVGNDTAVPCRSSASSKTCATNRRTATRSRTSSSTIASSWSFRAMGRFRPAARRDGARVPVVRRADERRPAQAPRRRSSRIVRAIDANAVVDAILPIDRLHIGHGRAAALLRGDARRVRRRRRCSSRRLASTACSPTRWCSARRRSASAWRSARSARRCWRWC